MYVASDDDLIESCHIKHLLFIIVKSKFSSLLQVKLTSKILEWFLNFVFQCYAKPKPHLCQVSGNKVKCDHPTLGL